jgi:hypothetical protein
MVALGRYNQHYVNQAMLGIGTFVTAWLNVEELPWSTRSTKIEWTLGRLLGTRHAAATLGHTNRAPGS